MLSNIFGYKYVINNLLNKNEVNMIVLSTSF